MRLHRLTITAFGPFAATEEVDFDALCAAGLFLLHGPTGAGKTSVLDAVCYALYGAVPGARQSPGATLRSDHAPVGTPTEIGLDLTVGGRRLEIVRRPAQLRPKKRTKGFTTEKAQTWLREYDAESGTWRALSRSHQEIGEEIGQLLGMSRDQFCQVVLLPQGDFARFLRADAEARGKLLGKLFDTRRFAAVEERLAELRRAAEHRVRAGDDRLLAVAQRLAQEAGDRTASSPGNRTAPPLGDLTSPPLPELRPGDAGFAGAVLEWAAVIRTGAHEWSDITESALTAAESRASAARQALDAERELAALQQRFADTRRRAEALEEQRSEHERARAGLERSHKAELVAPALSLRAEAEQAHRSATTEYARTRTLLPTGLTDAGAEQLAALEGNLRQELGALDAARRAEHRDTEITAERADLDRQARADDEVLQEAADWLAGWESRRGALQDRIEAAQEAATRAEQLAGQLDPARRRLDAARSRDTLEAAASEAGRHLNSAREHANTAHEHWLDLRGRRLAGMAAELAARLVDGEPCAVCGSAAHPGPALATDGHVDPAVEDTALEAYRNAVEARGRAEREHAAIRERHAAARAAAGESSVAELAALTERLDREHTEARRVAAGTHAAREALGRAEREYEDRLTAQREAERRVAARTSRRDALEREQSALQAELSRARGGASSVAERAAQLADRAGRLAEAAEAVRAVDTTALRLKEADGRLASAAFRAGFDTPEAAADALLTDTGRRVLQHRLDDWRAEAAAVADRLAEPQARAAADHPPARTEDAEAAHDAAERALRDASSAATTARSRRTELARLSRLAEAEVRALGPVREEYDRVARLAGLTAGTSTDNERRMRLESYVLAARLEQVAAAATVRLQRMSSGRYALVHSDARTGGQRRSGLGLQVIDAWTGSARDTSTLSGGETFFASLALALGLADVVTDEAGGVRLDTLFIDEGFGSLDDQTLDEVLDVLDSLRERDRSVGIVSHVADLRRRIPTQLEIVKDRHGSAIRQGTQGSP
ncbi:AAA family ATPase [Streptomyces scopuliridis]|uniref:Nuclease SbcCD subunit C n=1 Tax=Streptomyces scopuliridis RB72 TaxID=1440053 RepID=A0A2T7T6R9_9ACTN|nr:SMC family ATPase [Streptomyces scopuliridis]PVE10852.1 exonuclease [Streptomyces scopuliridis RB72]